MQPELCGDPALTHAPGGQLMDALGVLLRRPALR
jgi:hypothetical protein